MSYYSKFLIIACTVISLCACSLIQRHPRSGYYSTGYESPATPDLYQQRHVYEREQTLNELGYSASRPLSEEEQQHLMDRIELNRLEKRLDSTREKKQYYLHKPYFKDDRERIYFLNLPTFQAKERWLKVHGVSPGNEEYPDSVADMIEKGDIAVGMSRKAVQESWGDPDVVEVAGDPVYGNERWKYAKMVSSSNGYNKEMRIIYFEAGRVVGWEKQSSL